MIFNYVVLYLLVDNISKETTKYIFFINFFTFSDPLPFDAIS